MTKATTPRPPTEYTEGSHGYDFGRILLGVEGENGPGIFLTFPDKLFLILLEFIQLKPCHERPAMPLFMRFSKGF
jgi:hypothetical protein